MPPENNIEALLNTTLTAGGGPGAPASGAVGGEVVVRPGAIIATAHRMSDQIGPLLASAKADLEKAIPIMPTTFSKVGLGLEIAYMAATGFAVRGVQGLHDELTAISSGMVATAQNWRLAEHKSTVRVR